MSRRVDSVLEALSPLFSSTGNDFVNAKELLNKREAETGRESRSESVDQDFQNALKSLREIFAEHPVGLLKKALELTREGESQVLNTNAASMWVVNEGEKYLNKHLELYKEDS